MASYDNVDLSSVPSPRRMIEIFRAKAALDETFYITILDSGLGPGECVELYRGNAHRACLQHEKELGLIDAYWGAIRDMEDEPRATEDEMERLMLKKMVSKRNPHNRLMKVAAQ